MMADVNPEDVALATRHPELGLMMLEGGSIIAAALAPSLTMSGDPVPEHIRFVPGRSAVVQFRAHVGVDGDPPNLMRFVASLGRRVPGDPAIVSIEGRDVAVWRVPDDPYLPGLPILSNVTTTTPLLEQLGITGNIQSLRRRSYRPSRRAVVEIATTTHRVFAKVVRPDRTRRLQDVHTAVARHAPIPRSLGWSKRYGIAMLEALPGHPLRQVIEDPEGELPEPLELLALLDTLIEDDVGDTSLTGLVDAMPRHVRLIGAILPEVADRAIAIAGTVDDHATSSDTVAVHGDFHSSQVIVQSGRPTGLIDIDTVGLGQRVDDLANLLAHVSVIADSLGANRQRAVSYGARLTSVFDRVVDPQQLRLRTAAAILGYASGPFRVQEADWRDGTSRRVALAEEWVASAMSSR